MSARNAGRNLPHTIDLFWETIPPIWNRVKKNIRCIINDRFDIGVEEFHILRHISKGLSSVSELASAKQISRSAVSQAVNVLVEKGLLARSQNTRDRRCQRLELTSNGSSLLQSVFRANRRWMARSLSTFSPEEIDQVNQAMRTVKRHFGKEKP
ncbi:MAG: MarR family transcriptional regulator [Spirochaetes bacterium]|nr:MarR family transcriptional regulator [Spirochaetota bacterium]